MEYFKIPSCAGSLVSEFSNTVLFETDARVVFGLFVLFCLFCFRIILLLISSPSRLKLRERGFGEDGTVHEKFKLEFLSEFFSSEDSKAIGSEGFEKVARVIDSDEFRKFGDFREGEIEGEGDVGNRVALRAERNDFITLDDELEEEHERTNR